MISRTPSSASPSSSSYCYSMFTRIKVFLVVVVFARIMVDGARDTVSVNELSKYWIDARDVLDDLDQYQALWIKIHGCVWSECGVDNNDDDGEDRDGDEQWYLARTQDFCANVAFSLYGIPKNHMSLMTCSRGNFINSFFTYGGADTLLKALKQNPAVYYDGDYIDGYYNSNYGYNTSNADCVVDEQNYMSSTMGCSAHGKFAMASFEGEYCSGTDFYDIIDPLNKYNRQMGRVGCQKIWGRNFGSSEIATTLLSYSWTCDMNMYPNSCPDPYGKKANYDYALNAVAHGLSPSWAIANMKLKVPLRILSWLLIIMGIFLLIFGYHVQNRDRMAAHSGGLRGFFRVLSEDIHSYRKRLAKKRREAKSEARKLRDKQKSEKRKKKKRKSSRKSSKRSRRSSSRRRKSSRSRNRDDDDDDRDIELAPTGSSEYGGGSYESPVSSMLS